MSVVGHHDVVNRAALLAQRSRRPGSGRMVPDHGLGARLGVSDARRDEVDTSVDDDHDAERQVERTDRGVELVADRLADHAVAGAVLGLADEQWRNADESRENPDGDDHGGHAHRGPLHGVLERTSDDEVAVDADRAQVEDRRRAEENVKRRPHVTDGLAERPVAHHLVHGCERHHHHGDEKVGDSQRDDQQVGRRAQSADNGDCRTDEDVADDCPDDDDSTRQRDQHHSPHLVGTRRRHRVTTSGSVVVRHCGARDLVARRRL